MSTIYLKNEFSELLKLIQYLCSKLYVYPFTGKSKNTLICYSIIYILLLITSLQLIVTLAMTDFGDWLEIINIAPNIGVAVIATVKYTIMFRNSQLYEELMNHFQEDIWELTNLNAEKSTHVIIKYKNFTKFLIKFLCYFTAALTIVVVSFPFFIMMFESKILGKELKYLYPYDAVYPFDKLDWYFVAYAWEGLMTAIVILVHMTYAILNFSILLLMCMELKLLGVGLRALITPEEIRCIVKRKRLEDTHKNIKLKLKLFIRSYQYLDISFHKIKDDLEVVMSIGYIFGTVFICLTAFSALVVDDLFKSLRYFSFCVSLLFEMFNTCIISQVVKDHSEDLSIHTYFSEWTHADAQTKNILLMLLMRTQGPFILTANGHVLMDLNTFAEVCRASYQYFNLLRTLYKP